MYTACTGLCNDETGKRFKTGDPVTEDDFPAGVLKHWLATGVIEPAEDEPAKPTKKPAGKKTPANDEPAEVVFIEGKKPKGN